MQGGINMETKEKIILAILILAVTLIIIGIWLTAETVGGGLIKSGIVLFISIVCIMATTWEL